MTISCDRYSNDYTGFNSKKIMESWYPGYMTFNATDFEIPDDAGTKKVIKVMTYTMGSGGQVKQFWNLLPNGKLIANFPSKAGYKDAAIGRYKCSKNSLYVRVALAKNRASEPAKKPENTPAKPNLGNLTDVQICNLATKSNGDWESTNGRWAKQVSEAKHRGLNCGVEVEATDKISKISKLDKAKSLCTELGFTAGTEKHGDCVMKLYDK